jgi:hypothetical protein
MDEDDILDYPNNDEPDTVIFKWNKIHMTGIFARITNTVLILWILNWVVELGTWLYTTYLM